MLVARDRIEIVISNGKLVPRDSQTYSAIL
jgi:hypothetical protein